jgi:heme exporter protein CcmD
MNHWHFILGAYGLTLVLLVVEVLSVRARRRAAARTAAASGAPAREGSPGALRTPH